jgi:HD-GYP domain-containing protein (c-di-GMP phosphodiesterase class II)
MQAAKPESFRALALLNDYVSTDIQLALGACPQSLTTILKHVHKEVCARPEFQPLSRIGVTLYHATVDTAVTLVESCLGGQPVGHYEAPLSGSSSLRRVAASGQPRILHDLSTEASPRNAVLYAHGYRSSMACPVYSEHGLFGFVFFDADRSHFFDEGRISTLTAYAKVIALLVMHELLSVRMIKAVAKTALAMARLRDDETGAHLERMANYARIIARDGAERWGLSDEFIEFLFLFAPLHDIGKVGVPDHVLLKPGKLDAVQMAQMRLHVSYGLQIMDSLVSEFGFSAVPHLDIARNVIGAHHENVDGTGYPRGLVGREIPLEGRIVAVADVFDALTSDRPYKRRWSNEEAFAYVRNLAGTKFDPDCVECFLRHRDEVVEIQQRVEEQGDSADVSCEPLLTASPAPADSSSAGIAG